MKHTNRQQFIRTLEGTITEQELLTNKHYTNILDYVSKGEGSIDKLFIEGYELSKNSPNEAQFFFLLISLIPNLSARHRDTATEAHLLVQGEKREDYASLDELIKEFRS